MNEEKKNEIKAYFVNFFGRHHRKYKNGDEWRSKVIDELTELFYATTQPKKRGPKPSTGNPAVEEVRAFFKENQALERWADEFFDYYEMVGWVVGKSKPIKNWRMAAKRWIRRTPEIEKNKPQEAKVNDFMERARANAKRS